MGPQDTATARLVLRNSEGSLRHAAAKMAQHHQLADETEGQQRRYHQDTADYYWRASNELVARIALLKQLLR